MATNRNISRVHVARARPATRTQRAWDSTVTFMKNDPMVQEYVEEQKRLARITLKKAVRRLEKEIDERLS